MSAPRLDPPYRLNLALAAAALATAVVMLVIVPLALLPHTPLAAGIAILAASLLTPFHTAVLHEAIHRRLAERPAVNDRIGRLLAIGSGVSFDVIRFGHLSHHVFNRHALDRPDVIEPGQSQAAAVLKHYTHLLGGLYAGEVFGSLAMLLPRRLIDAMLARAYAADEPALASMRNAAGRGLDRRMRRIRLDVTLAVVIYAGAFYLYGTYWPLLLFGVALRGLIVSLQDNLPHYGTPAVIGADALNTRAPRWAETLMLNQNLHAVHHDRPDLPWTALPGVFARDGGRYANGYLTQLLRQFRGPQQPNAAA